MKSSEPLNVFANLINSNHGTGVTVLQSSQLTRLVTNCIISNCRGGVTVEKECRVELRGNGIYKNSGHGVSFNGNGQIVENDVVGNQGCGIQVSDSADIKVRWTIFYNAACNSLMNYQHLYCIKLKKSIFLFRFCGIASNQHRAVGLLCMGQ